MKRLLLIFLGLILVCLSCKKEKKELILQGSTTILPIAQRCAEEFNKINPSVIISVRGGGSGVGIASPVFPKTSGVGLGEDEAGVCVAGGHPGG